MTTEDKLHIAEVRLTRALWLLREWRDEFGGRAVIVHKNGWGGVAGARKADLLRDTERLLEGK